MSSKEVKQKKRIEVLDFARDHGLVIHPGKGYDYYIESFLKFQYCPCDSTRKNCPCPESVEECREIGWCKCRLFWRDHDTFKIHHIGG